MAKPSSPEDKIKRCIFVQTGLGIYADTFFPKEEGLNYKMPEVLKVLEPYRKDFTVFSNIDHDMKGGHGATHTFLSGIKYTNSSAWRDGNISLDQRLAEHVGNKTRISSLLLGQTTQTGGGWTRYGTRLPQISLKDAYEAMFLESNKNAKKAKKEILARGLSVLDAANANSKALHKKLGKEDKERVDEYFTSVRNAEKQLQDAGAWVDKPKPKVKMKHPKSSKSKKCDLANELTVLALQTDSTRVAFLDAINDFEDLEFVGLDQGSYHLLSHHGMRPDLIKKLKKAERFFLTRFGKLIKTLKDTKDVTGASLFDSTILMYGSGMGDGSRHTNTNLPILLSGGGAEAKGHINNDHKQPLNSLYLSILQWFGVETDYFNTTDKAYRGLVFK